MRNRQGLLAILGLMVLATACGGGSSGSATHASGSTPLNAADPPAFSGEPNYQKIPITGAQSVGLSDQDARDLLRWTVRFATYEWSFSDGQTQGLRIRKAFPYFTPRLQAVDPSPASEAAARKADATGYQRGRQRITWPSPLSAVLDPSKDYSGDVRIGVGPGQAIADAAVRPFNIAVRLEVKKVAGHWRLDTYEAVGVDLGNGGELI